MHINLPPRPNPSGRSRSRAQLERHIPAYREYLTERGNAAGYLRNCEAAVAHLSMWVKHVDKRLANVDEGLVTEFVEHRRFFAAQAKNYKTPSSLGVVVSSARRAAANITHGPMSKRLTSSIISSIASIHPNVALNFRHSLIETPWQRCTTQPTLGDPSEHRH